MRRSTRLPIVMLRCAVAIWIAACSPPPAATPSLRAPATAVAPAPPDPDLNRPPPRKLLAIDWSKISLATDADARAVWAQIAPTGFDWQEKLGEVPHDAARRLAVALLRGGNFTCVKPAPPNACAPPVQVPEPAHAAGFTDPCLRRLLALWSIEQLEEADLIHVIDAYNAIAAIPPPESELIAAMLGSVPESDPSWRLELIAIGWRAGHRDAVTPELGRLGPDLLRTAVTKHHIDAALDTLPATDYEDAFVAAINDEAIAGARRSRAVRELEGAALAARKMSRNVERALNKALASTDCEVAGAAVRALEEGGKTPKPPKRPHTQSPAVMMRALCVLASYERVPDGSGAEPSKLLRTFVPPRGLEIRLVTYDALSDGDTDGDGDPHTQRSLEVISGAALALPEPEDLVRAMNHCKGTTCTSDDREFRFTFQPSGGALLLTRIDVIERPPCPALAIPRS